MKIKVDNLGFRYTGGKERALEGITFTVNQGEFIGIMGKNKSGKSTLASALVGLIPHFFKGAMRGNVYIDGLDTQETPIAELCQKVGIVFQNPFNQISGAKLTVYEEVSFGLENIGLPRNQMIERIEEVLELFGIAHLKDRNPFSLSGGQMQRLALACIMALRPEIVVLDEPTSQLDPLGVEEVYKSIAKLKEKGLTVLLIEHKTEYLAEYSDKILLLENGKLKNYDTPERIFGTNPGIQAPVYTQVCQALNKPKENGLYPVTLKDTIPLLKG